MGFGMARQCSRKVSRPVDGLDPPSVPRVAQRVKRPRRTTWSRVDPRFCAYALADRRPTWRSRLAHPPAAETRPASRSWRCTGC
jgi:hypothetical protein